MVGFFGQGLFFMRFVIQWLASEKAQDSVMPTAFWYFSIAGALILFAYALHRQDPVFFIGQALALLIYGRNLYFVHTRKKSAK
ncbi:MAG: lipid-A-disaccharide synthase N-terminal domain-containing protein [Bdellovibrionales bacterium]